MNKKKVALTACAAALVGTLAVGGTLAYLTQVTNTVDNVFSSDSNLTGELVEPSWNQETASKYVPGQTIAKDPQLKSTCDFDAYVAIQSEVDRIWKCKKEWIRRSILTTAGMGSFSSDKSQEIMN